MGSVGLIIGATIGQWMQDSGVDPSKFTGPILSPGYGWQGAEAKDLKTVFRGTRGNVLVTVSRFIASHGPDIAALSQATESIALDVRQALMEATVEGRKTSNQNGIRCRGMRTCLSHRVRRITIHILPCSSGL